MEIDQVRLEMYGLRNKRSKSKEISKMKHIAMKVLGLFERSGAVQFSFERVGISIG